MVKRHWANLCSPHTSLLREGMIARLTSDLRSAGRALEAVLEAQTSEWQAALAERELLQHQLAAAGALAGIGTARQLRLEQERNAGLVEQLSCCKVQLAQLEATLQQVWSFVVPA